MLVNCPNCNGSVVKRGKRRTKYGIKQLYFCKVCKKRFTVDSIKKSYPLKIILSSISLYNRGFALDDIVEVVFKKFKNKVSKSSVHRWVNEFSPLCNYSKIRDEVLKKLGKDILVSRWFKHQGVVYNFKYHRGKLSLLSSYDDLVRYLENFNRGYPKEFFDNSFRCSQVKVNAFTRKEFGNNYACKLAELALKACDEKKDRHRAVEEFMLINDTATVAAEVPVWFWEKSIGGVTGHIDVLQVRQGKIYVLDFKPDEIKDRKVMSQLYLYALGLSFRTSIPLKQFRCAWFNDKVYYEFEPARIKIGVDTRSDVR